MGMTNSELALSVCKHNRPHLKTICTPGGCVYSLVFPTLTAGGTTVCYMLTVTWCVTGSIMKGRRQLVDSRAMAAKPGRPDEQDPKARAEARARQRAAMQAKQDPPKVPALV